MPERIQFSRRWKLPQNAKLVARGSRWGNPFRLNENSVVGREWNTLTCDRFMPTYVSAWHGQEVLYVSCSDHDTARDHAVRLFRSYCEVRQRDVPERFNEWLEPLRGRDLACWCRLDQACHADVLLEIANA